MEPRVQYARTKDGVNIAFWSIGEGEPLIFLPSMPMSHIEYEWQFPEWRAFYERFADRRRVIRWPVGERCAWLTSCPIRSSCTSAAQPAAST